MPFNEKYVANAICLRKLQITDTDIEIFNMPNREPVNTSTDIEYTFSFQLAYKYIKCYNITNFSCMIEI